MRQARHSETDQANDVVSPRKGVRKCRENGSQEPRIRQPRPAGGIANLLLVNPSLCVFTCHIKPFRSSLGASPIDGISQLTQFERTKVTQRLVRRKFKEFGGAGLDAY